MQKYRLAPAPNIPHLHLNDMKRMMKKKYEETAGKAGFSEVKSLKLSNATAITCVPADDDAPIFIAEEGKITEVHIKRNYFEVSAQIHRSIDIR